MDDIGLCCIGFLCLDMVGVVGSSPIAPTNIALVMIITRAFLFMATIQARGLRDDEPS
ncbi:MAG: hypothetical protein RLZZ591_1660 [Pseudomonadota bacterium]|jgi:hypothetical protein